MRQFIDPSQPLNGRHALNQSLYGWWYVVQNPGWRGLTFRDLCRRNHPALINTPTWQGHRGRPGGCGSLRTTASAGGNATFTMSYTGGMTVSIWAAQNAAGSYPYAITLDSGGNSGLRFDAGTQKPAISNSAGTSVASATAITLGVWVHMLGVWDGTNQTLYVNGVQEAQGATSFQSLATIKFAGGFTGLDGWIDDIRIYLRAMSATQARELYLESRAGYPNAANWLGTPLNFPEQAAAAAGHPAGRRFGLTAYSGVTGIGRKGVRVF